MGMFAAIVLELVATLVIGFGAPASARDEVVAKPRAAQLRLARMLRDADAIESVTANGRTITFVIAEHGQALRVVASTRDGGRVTALVIAHSDEPVEEPGNLTWLASELADVRAITRLETDEDGAVTITTSDDRRYMIIPGRGSGGPASNDVNEAVEARWAASWNRSSAALRGPRN
jgi:hypothetical protein